MPITGPQWSLLQPRASKNEVLSKHDRFPPVTMVSIFSSLLQAREWYREDMVGQAITESRVQRHTLFLISKLHPRHHGYNSAASQIKEVLITV